MSKVVYPCKALQDLRWRFMPEDRQNIGVGAGLGIDTYFLKCPPGKIRRILAVHAEVIKTTPTMTTVAVYTADRQRHLYDLINHVPTSIFVNYPSSYSIESEMGSAHEVYMLPDQELRVAVAPTPGEGIGISVTTTFLEADM